MTPLKFNQYYPKQYNDESHYPFDYSTCNSPSMQ